MKNFHGYDWDGGSDIMIEKSQPHLSDGSFQYIDLGEGRSHRVHLVDNVLVLFLMEGSSSKLDLQSFIQVSLASLPTGLRDQGLGITKRCQLGQITMKMKVLMTDNREILPH